MSGTRVGTFLCVLAAWAVLALGTAAQAAITHGTTTINMDFVNVGYAGNTADDSGYGAVAYKYQIGKYEVTAAQWAAVQTADPNVGNAGYWSDSEPTGGISWHEAAKLSNWLTTGHYDQGYYSIDSGGLATIPSGVSHDAYAAAHGTTYFIPTENEWYKAAYHKNNGVTGGADNYWNYPTGSDSMPVGIRNPQNVPFDAVFYDFYDGPDGYTQDYPNDVTNAGVASPYGTIGQGGNIWEWDEAVVWGLGWWRGVRGGYSNSGPELLHASGRYSSDPAYEYGNNGFRVASIEAIPEPGSLAVWAGVALTALLCWSRKRA